MTYYCVVSSDGCVSHIASSFFSVLVNKQRCINGEGLGVRIRPKADSNRDVARIVRRLNENRGVAALRLKSYQTPV